MANDVPPEFASVLGLTVMHLPAEVVDELETKILRHPDLRTLVPTKRRLANLRHPFGSETLPTAPDRAFTRLLALHGAGYLRSRGLGRSFTPRVVSISPAGPRMLNQRERQIVFDIMLQLTQTYELGCEFPVSMIGPRDLEHYRRRRRPINYGVTIENVRWINRDSYSTVESSFRAFLDCFLDLHDVAPSKRRTMGKRLSKVFSDLKLIVADIDFEPRADRLLLVLDDLLAVRQPLLGSQDRWMVLGRLMEIFEAQKVFQGDVGRRMKAKLQAVRGRLHARGQ